MSVSRLGRGPLIKLHVQVCAIVCEYVQVCASMCKCVYYCCGGSSLCTQGFYLLRQKVQLQVTSHGQNIFAETPVLLSSLACAAQCSCACGSYQRCRAQCVCIPAPTGHRPSVYERIRWGDPPSPSCARCLSESPGVFGLQETLLFGRPMS